MSPPKNTHYLKFYSGETIEANNRVPVEAAVALTVNGEIWTTFMCTPSQQEVLMLGFLFNEGIINTIEDIADIRVCEHGDNVDVWTVKRVEKPAKWRRTTGCTGGATAVDTISLPRPVFPPSDSRITPQQITRLVSLLFESQELYKESGGVHTSALCGRAHVLLSAEDIGRHNTLDKLAGLWLQGKAQWTASDPKVLVSTGRVSSEMLQKAARMGVSILVSRTSPSSLSIELAKKWNITLVGYARRDRFNVYSHPERIRDNIDQSAG